MKSTAPSSVIMENLLAKNRFDIALEISERSIGKWFISIVRRISKGQLTQVLMGLPLSAVFRI